MASRIFKSSQAALEFLMTYGWAFLIILIMIGAISYFGILNPRKLLPNRCSFGSEFQCLATQISATANTFRIRLKNGLGTSITVQSTKLSSESTTQFACTATPLDYTSQLWSAVNWSQSGLVAYVASNVNDANKAANAFHTDSSAIGSFLQLDVGSGQSREFTRLDISVNSAVNAIWDIQYSDDALAWSTVYTGASSTAITPGTTGTFTWNGAGLHRYWRMYKTSSPGGGGYHSEIQFYEGNSLQTWRAGDVKDLIWSGCNSAAAGFLQGEKRKVLVAITYYDISSGSGYANDVKGDVFYNVE